MVCRSRLYPQAVGGYLMSGAGEPDFPNQTLLPVTHYRDDRRVRKIWRTAGNERCNKQGKRECCKNPHSMPPEGYAVPKFHNQVHEPANLALGAELDRGSVQRLAIPEP